MLGSQGPQVKGKAFVLLYLLVSQSPINIVQGARIAHSEKQTKVGMQSRQERKSFSSSTSWLQQEQNDEAGPSPAPSKRMSEADLGTVLLSGDLQYKFKKAHMGESSGYKAIRLVLSYHKDTKDLKLHALVGKEGKYKNLEGTTGFPIDDQTRIEFMADRGSKNRMLMLSRGGAVQEYIKIRAPRTKFEVPYLKSGRGVTWVSKVPNFLTLIRGSGDKQKVEEFTGKRREAHILETLGADLETARQTINGHPCILAGTCISYCPPPVVEKLGGAAVCQPAQFCKLSSSGDKCDPVTAQEGDDTPVVNAWRTAISELKEKLDPRTVLTGRQDKDDLQIAIGAVTFLRRIEDDVNMLDEKHIWRHKLPNFVKEVQGKGLDEVTEALAGIMEDLGVVEEQAKADFGCEITPIRLKGLSKEDRATELERAEDQCPQLDDTATSAGSLIDQYSANVTDSALSAGALVERDGMELGLDPITWAIIITASAWVIFTIGARYTKGNKKYRKLHIFFKAAQSVTFTVLIMEVFAVALVGMAGASANAGTVAHQWGMLEAMWVADVGPLWSLYTTLGVYGAFTFGMFAHGAKKNIDAELEAKNGVDEEENAPDGHDDEPEPNHVEDEFQELQSEGPKKKKKTKAEVDYDFLGERS